jgi:hypothetical protein
MTWLKIGDKVVSIEEFKKIGEKTIPVLKAVSEEITNPDGSVDVIVKVPCLQIRSKTEEIV